MALSPDLAPATETSGDTAPQPVSWVPYTLPMFLFLVLTQGETYFPKPLYPVVYAIKAVAVTIALVLCAKTWRHELRFDSKAILLGVIAGLIGLPLWLGIDAITPHVSFLGTRVAYNPFTEIESSPLRLVFLAVRLFGLAIMVPIMEEVFWRSFLLRYVTDQDRWYNLPIGTFSLLAGGIVCAVFGFVHPEYLAGIAFAILMTVLLRQTRNLLSCVVAHGVTNLSLGIYVLATGHWNYW